MRESRTYGFVRGAPRDRCPYRDPELTPRRKRLASSETCNFGVNGCGQFCFVHGEHDSYPELCPQGNHLSRYSPALVRTNSSSIAPAISDPMLWQERTGKFDTKLHRQLRLNAVAEASSS